MLTILQCIVPCIVDFLPKNSALVHCIRAYLSYRILVGLTCMTQSRLEHLRIALQDYQKYCAVSCLACPSYGLQFLSNSDRKSGTNMGRVLIS